MTTSLSAPVGTEALELEFRVACEEFARARASQRTKDTPAARRQVEDRLAAVNATLDRALDQARHTVATYRWAV